MRLSYRLSALLAGLAVVLTLPLAAMGSRNLDEVCHFVHSESGSVRWKPIEVALPSVDAHLNHGDGIPGGEVPGTDHKYVFDNACQQKLVEIVFAVAYTDVDPDDGAYNAGVDVLIAKLIDGPGSANDGILGAGDLVITNKYPTDFDASTFGVFTTTEHVVAPFQVNNDVCTVRGTEGAFIWRDDSQAEFYREYRLTDLNMRTDLVDSLDSRVSNKLQATSDAPSHPSVSLFEISWVSTDEPFVDVDLNCGA